MAGPYDRYILPRLIDIACGIGLAREQRAKLLPLAQGVVLEPGIGSGLNLPLYDSAKVTRLVGVDPSAELLALARPRAASVGFPVELHCTGAEAIPMADGSADCAVLTWTLCSIPEPLAALREMRRVLKPGAPVLVCEHGLAPDAGVAGWQRRVDPLWGWFAGGCHLSRDPAALLAEAGFGQQQIERFYLRGAPRLAGYQYVGTAQATHRRVTAQVPGSL